MQYSIQPISINNTESVSVCTPSCLQNVPSVHSPYWAKVWHSAVALCMFLQQHKNYIAQKQVLEIAAGLGLPSLYAAKYATQVCATDIEPQAIQCIQQSIHHHQIKNITTAVAAWNEINNPHQYQTVLLSDVNYDVQQFEVLQQTIYNFLQQKATLILTTPQRLMAKPFITLLLPYCVQQQEIEVNFNNTTVPISVFVLQANNA